MKNATQINCNVGHHGQFPMAFSKDPLASCSFDPLFD